MSAYWLCVASGGAAALALGVLRAARGERWRVVAVLLPTLAIGMAGARGAYVALHPGAPLFGRQGQMLDGALLAIVLAAAVFSRPAGVPPLKALDLLAPGIGLGIAIARIGCLVNGCCLGVPTGAPWGIAAPGAEPAFQEVPILGVFVVQPRLNPSPVYEMLLALVAAGAVLWWVRRPARQSKPPRAGASFFAFLLILEVGRVLLSPLRAPDPSSLLPAAATSGMVAALAAAMLLWRLTAYPGDHRLAKKLP